MRNMKTGYKIIHNLQFTINHLVLCSLPFSPISRDSWHFSFSMASWSISWSFRHFANIFPHISILRWIISRRSRFTSSISSSFYYSSSSHDSSESGRSSRLSRSRFFLDSVRTWPMSSPRWVWWRGGVGIWLRSIQHGEQFWLLLLLS